MRTKNLQLLPLDEEPAKASLIQPAGSGYVLLAAEVDAHPLLWPSRTKRYLVDECLRWCETALRAPGVLEAVTFNAVLFPPIGEPGFLRRRRDQYHRARFDLVVLVETDSVQHAEQLFDSPSFRFLEAHLRNEASHVYAVTAANAKRIGAVDHRHDGVFLFNY